MFPDSSDVPRLRTVIPSSLSRYTFNAARSLLLLVEATSTTMGDLQTLRQCKECKRLLPIEDFYLRRAGQRRTQCKKCWRDRIKRNRQKRLETNPARLREINHRYYLATRNRVSKKNQSYYLTHKDETRDRDLRRRYGITLQEYQAAYEKQSGLCAICGEWFKSLIVDHDHNTGRFRGLLCSLCNIALGQYEKSKAFAHQFEKYLRESAGEQ